MHFALSTAFVISVFGAVKAPALVEVDLSALGEDASFPERYEVSVHVTASVAGEDTARGLEIAGGLPARRVGALLVPGPGPAAPPGIFLRGPAGIPFEFGYDAAVLPDGVLAVLDPYQSRIQRFDPGGKPLAPLPLAGAFEIDYLSVSRFLRRLATGIAADGEGRLYVYDAGRGVLSVLDSRGRLLAERALSGFYEHRVTLEGNGGEVRLLRWDDDKGGRDAWTCRFGRRGLEMVGPRREEPEEAPGFLASREDPESFLLEFPEGAVRVRSPNRLSGIRPLGTDGEGNHYVYVEGKHLPESGVLKFSPRGVLRARVAVLDHWFRKDWKGGCAEVVGLRNGGLVANLLVDRSGRILVTQRLCAAKDGEWARLRILRLVPKPMVSASGRESLRGKGGAP